MSGVLLFLLFSSAQGESWLERGEYLVRAGSCRACHTAEPEQDFAGGFRLATKFGDFYTPNITPDMETGIGKWNPAEFRQALRQGIAPDGHIYYPTFPYPSFTKMTDDDIDAIFGYLRTQRPIKKINRPFRLKFPFDQRWLMHIWKFNFVTIGPLEPNPQESEAWNRGAYYVEAVLHCAECHTPRGCLGQPKDNLAMSGSELIFEGVHPPNITPAALPWTSEQWMTFLASGIDPKGNTPGTEMALVVRATSALSRSDQEAVTQYLRALTPVREDHE
jgi:mono/diheme cytochrome c family protein